MIKIRSTTFMTISLFLFLATGCQHSNAAVVNVITFQPSDYDVMFFTNNSSKDIEEIYVDAIIELKAKYPTEFKDIEAKEKSINELQYSINPEDPTLIITKNGQTIAKLSGEMPKTEIQEQLELTMDH